MKKIITIIILASLGLYQYNVYANEDKQLVAVPFQNLFLNPKGKIQASYSFGGHPIIFCFENNLQSVGKVNWTYKQKFVGPAAMPIQFKINSNFEGQLADPSGFIIIENNANHVLIVSCEFGF